MSLRQLKHGTQSGTLQDQTSGESKNFEKRGGGGRQFISSILIYLKCAQRNTCFLHGKKRFFDKNVSQ